MVAREGLEEIQRDGSRLKTEVLQSLTITGIETLVFVEHANEIAI